MAKVSGSYASVIQGVSQQVAQDRRPGQHWEQVNMISDPVRGLSRRQGSILEAETLVGARNAAYDAATLLDTQDYKELTFFVGPKEYSLLYRTKARPTNSQAPALVCYSKDDQQFIPVSETAGALLNTLKANGVSAVVNVGRYLYFAPNNHTPSYTITSPWASSPNNTWGVVWVRTGAYSRTYRITLRSNLGTVTVTHTTPQSSYPGTLDTSDIPTSDPDYNKKVTDRQSAYQTAVTQWIGTASAAIQPQAIAGALATALGAVLPGWGVGVYDSHIAVQAASGQTIIDMIVDDGGNGDGAWAVGNEVPEVARLSARHAVVNDDLTKVVRIRPKKADQEDAYYMRALPRIPGTANWPEVTWVETAGQVATPAPANTLVFATVEGGTLHIASSAAELATATGLTVPGFSSRAVGDAITSPVPFLFGKQITYMGLIQDRLLIAAGSVLFLSRPGDYLNWWRKSVLTVDNADPIEMFALGAEDDVVTAGVSYDRSIVLFGKRKQYIINGRQNITPQNASVVVMSSYEDATEADPQSNGNFVFYAKSRHGRTSLHQIQTGLVAEAPETYEVSKQLDTYIEGRPVQILPVMAPNTLFIRTTGDRQSVYVYTYMDSPDGGQRLFDSWSKWAWHDVLGHVVGMTYTDGDILVFTLRPSPDPDDVASWWLCADRFTLTTELSERPYVDSARRWEDYMLDTGSLRPGYAAGVDSSWAAVGRGGRRQFMGVPAELLPSLVAEFPDQLDNVWVGADSAELSYVIPTNPYIRDRNEKAIINGRLTINRYSTYLADSGGMIATITTPGRGEYQVLDWTGRTVGRPSSEVGIQPIVTGSVPVPVGRETREFTYKLRAKKWLPFTLTAIEWVGQLFYNQRRV